MFSDETFARFDAPRPPTPITARFSFSLRFLPLTIPGAAKAPTAEPTTIRPNCLRVEDPPETRPSRLTLMMLPPDRGGSPMPSVRSRPCHALDGTSPQDGSTLSPMQPPCLPHDRHPRAGRR